MAFKELRNLHLISYADGLIDDSEFIVLYDGPVLFDSGGFLFVAQLLVLFWSSKWIQISNSSWPAVTRLLKRIQCRIVLPYLSSLRAPHNHTMSRRRRRLISSSMLKVPIEIVHVLTGTCFPALHVQGGIEKLIVVIVFYLSLILTARHRKVHLFLKTLTFKSWKQPRKKTKELRLVLLCCTLMARTLRWCPEASYISSSLLNFLRMTSWQVIKWSWLMVKVQMKVNQEANTQTTTNHQRRRTFTL